MSSVLHALNSTRNGLMAPNRMRCKSPPITRVMLCAVVIALCACAAAAGGDSDERSQIVQEFDRNGDGKVMPVVQYSFSATRNALCMSPWMKSLPLLKGCRLTKGRMCVPSTCAHFFDVAAATAAAVVAACLHQLPDILRMFSPLAPN